MLNYTRTLQTSASTISSSVQETASAVPHPRYPNRLRAWIKQEGYTFREIAASTGIPESTLYDWAAGNRPIPHPMRYRLAHLFGCTIRELIPESMIAATDSSEARMQQAQGLIRQVVALLAPCSFDDIHQFVSQVVATVEGEES